MILREIIEKDLVDFGGLCLAESIVPLETIKKWGISLAWKFNASRAKSFKQVLIAGGGKDKGKYFIADIKEIISTKEAYYTGILKKVIEVHEEHFGNWISSRIDGTITDNVLNDRMVVVFENPSRIKNFSSDKFAFNSNPVYYKLNLAQQEVILADHFEIKNVGKIKSANIKLNGLTIITGINDTGKSTIGKLLFSIVKAISRYEQDLNEGKEAILFGKIEKLYFKLRSSRDFGKDELIRDEFQPRIFLNQIKKFIDRNQQSIFPTDEIEQIKKLFIYKFEILSKSLGIGSKESLTLLNDIQTTLLENEEKDVRMKRALTRVLFSEFQSEITPKGSNRKSSIKYIAGVNDILDIEIEKNEIKTLSLKDELTFKDVIYIETPLLLNFKDLMLSAETLLENDNSRDSFRFSRPIPKVSLHVKDLISKIENAKYLSTNIFENDFTSFEIIKRISSIIKGGFTFDKETNDFLFSQKVDKEKNIQIKPVNIASGIKSFGIIQLLLQANTLNDKSLLIIDEPENHLHPQWQVEYAKIIIDLVKQDICVIINSHSPYMIQALKHFSDIDKMQRKTSFYYTENIESEGLSEMKDVTNDLNVIFRKLAEPLNELVWK